MNWRELGEDLRFWIPQSSRIYEQYRTSLSVFCCTKCRMAHSSIVNCKYSYQFCFNIKTGNVGTSNCLNICQKPLYQQWECSFNYQSLKWLPNNSCIDQRKGCSNFLDFTAVYHCHQTSFKPAQPYQCENIFSLLYSIHRLKRDHFGSFKSNIMYMLVKQKA